MKFIKDLEQSLRPGIKAILKHPFLKRIEKGSLTKGQLKYFIGQYSYYCEYFPRFLSACAANIPSDVTRMPLIENLWEEHGEGKMKESHRVLFDNFAKAAGVSITDLKNTPPLITTEAAVKNLFNVCLQSDYLKSLGALGPGTEFFTNDEYKIIVKGLKKYKFFNDKNLRFWTVHITMDEGHYQEMLSIIKPLAKSSKDRASIASGAKLAIELELLFWDGLEKNLPKK